MTATAAEVPHLPDGASWPRRILVGLQALMILKEDAGHPQAGALINRAFDYEVYQGHIERMGSTDVGEALLRERPSMKRSDLDLPALAALPAGTLGHELSAYFERNGFPPFHTDQPIEDPLDYVSKRYRETHDCYHVVTGYGTDDLGEMELQAFVMGNLGIRSPWLILAFGYPYVGLLQHRLAPWRYVGLLRRAWRRGRASRPFLEYPFDQRWTTSVAGIQQELGLAES